MAWGLIGGSLAHSYSPAIHALLGDYPYGLYPMAADELPAFFRGTALRGFNVTIPHKRAVIPFLQEVSPQARRIGSVNTVFRGPGGAWYGDNTDYDGFARLLGDTRAFQGGKALVLGSGGASKTVQCVLADRDIESVVVSRSGPVYYTSLKAHRDAALIINTTPVGMYPHTDAQPLELSDFRDCRLVVDLIYNPYHTRLLLQAQALGIPSRGGLLMLAAQAQRAAELFGVRPPGEDVSDKVARIIANRMRNIALIGMPGCGKTTVGRALSALSGRPFHDTDEMVEQMAGMTIPALLLYQGEAAFRELETRALAHVAPLSGVVIATGGGVVVQPRNRELLLMNSRTIWLKRDIHLLPTAGRPLSQGMGVQALYNARSPLYALWSEQSFENIGIAATAKAMLEGLA